MSANPGSVISVSIVGRRTLGHTIRPMSIQTDRVGASTKGDTLMQVRITPLTASTGRGGGNTPTYVAINRQSSNIFKGEVAKIVVRTDRNTNSSRLISVVLGSGSNRTI